ncbi:disease resistance protein L6-like [Apium graveolens]|uniref:disease resistance protein L6-like n=1 Tax=Apium graveolens TaxID=4045 RepID=UPI003D7BD5D3
MASTSYNHNPSPYFSTRWEVFLSFRGTDTRYSFTDYLYNSLHRTGIRTFRDDPDLRRGEIISDALIQAIHESKSYVDQGGEPVRIPGLQKYVLLEINPLTLEVAKHPVGLDSRIQDITTLLSSDAEGVIKIGLHGMGGVGKTTLAKAVYNQNYHCFQGSCFLANVREVSQTEKGLVCLQQQLINDVLRCKNIHIDNVDQGIELIRARICVAKVLIVIDDLDDPKALEYLEGPFPSGSAIIITTRNEDLLDSIKIEIKYKVNELSDAESRELFTQHAFKNDEISDTFTQLSEEILERAGGLPLALMVFGSNLLNQSEEGWRWFIHKLKRVSIDDVEKKLVVSFNALKMVDPMLQEIFLDIACVFVGRKIEEVTKNLETFYTFVNHNICILKKRC